MNSRKTTQLIKQLFPGVFIVMRQLSVVCLAAFVLTSCLGPKKIDKWVAQQYEGSFSAKPPKKTDMITVTSNLPFAGDHISTTEKNTSHMLPLLFYWQWDYKNTCTLNPQIPVNNFTKTVLTYSNKGLKQKLKGQRIELTVDKIPNTFAIDDKGHMIWVIYTFGWDVISFQPENKELIVSYKLFTADNTEIKKGVITVADSNKKLFLKRYQSIKKRTWQYLDQYDANIAAMSKQVVDKLVAEL